MILIRDQLILNKMNLKVNEDKSKVMVLGGEERSEYEVSVNGRQTEPVS